MGFEQCLFQNAGRETFESQSSLQQAGLDLLCRQCVLFILLCCAFGLFNKRPTALWLPLKLFRDSLTHTHTNTQRWVNFLYYCYVMHRRWTAGSHTQHARKHKHPLSAQRHKHMCAEPGRWGRGARPFSNHWWVLQYLNCFSEQNGEKMKTESLIILNRKTYTGVNLFWILKLFWIVFSWGKNVEKNKK